MGKIFKMNTAENFVDTLPEKVKTKFQEMYPLENNSIETFLKRNEWCHGIGKWQAEKIYKKKRFVFFLRKNKMDLSTFYLLKRITSKPFKRVELNKPVRVCNTLYTKVLSEPPCTNKDYIYIDFMKIYLEK